MDLIILITFIVAGTLWFGLLLAALLGKILLLVLSNMKRNKRSWTERALEAEAVILSTEKIDNWVNNQAKIKIQLQVQPAKGRNFITELNQLFDEANAGIFKTGNKIRVKYNPDNYRELVLVQAA